MSGKKFLLFTAVLSMVGLPAFASNIALNKTVSLAGSGYNTGNGYACTGGSASANTVTDGVFLPEQTCWYDGVAWTGTSAIINIDLGGVFDITSAIVQADDNDTYALQYLGTDGVYHDWWSIPSISSWGLVTRNSGALATAVAKGLRIYATGGDGYYSVSEVQVEGTPVSSTPEPSSLILLGTGVAGLAGVLRRKLRA